MPTVNRPPFRAMAVWLAAALLLTCLPAGAAEPQTVYRNLYIPAAKSVLTEENNASSERSLTVLAGRCEDSGVKIVPGAGGMPDMAQGVAHITVLHAENGAVKAGERVAIHSFYLAHTTQEGGAAALLPPLLPGKTYAVLVCKTMGGYMLGGSYIPTQGEKAAWEGRTVGFIPVDPERPFVEEVPQGTQDIGAWLRSRPVWAGYLKLADINRHSVMLMETSQPLPVRLAQGRMPAAGECLMDVAFAARHGYRVGDSLSAVPCTGRGLFGGDGQFMFSFLNEYLDSMAPGGQETPALSYLVCGLYSPPENGWPYGADTLIGAR